MSLSSMPTLALVCLLASCAFASPVSELVMSNFTTFIPQEKDEFAFVKLYAPECEQCEILSPIFEELAEKMKDSVFFAQVNGAEEENEKIMDELSVPGFPALFVFKEGKPVAEYFGLWEIPEMEGFLLRHKEASFSVLSSETDLDAFIKRATENPNFPAVVGCFEKQDDELEQFAAFKKISEQMLMDASFAVLTDKAACDHLGANVSSIVLYRQWAKPTALIFQGPTYTLDQAVAWVNKRRHPPISTLTMGNAQQHMARGLPLMVLFHHPASQPQAEMQKLFAPVAEAHYEDLALVTTSNDTFASTMSDFGLASHVVPQAVVDASGWEHGNNHVYVCPKSASAEDLTECAKSFLAGDLQPINMEDDSHTKGDHEEMDPEAVDDHDEAHDDDEEEGQDLDDYPTPEVEDLSSEEMVSTFLKKHLSEQKSVVLAHVPDGGEALDEWHGLHRYIFPFVAYGSVTDSKLLSQLYSTPETGPVAVLVKQHKEHSEVQHMQYAGDFLGDSLWDWVREHAPPTVIKMTPEVPQIFPDRPFFIFYYNPEESDSEAAAHDLVYKLSTQAELKDKFSFAISDEVPAEDTPLLYIDAYETQYMHPSQTERETGYTVTFEDMQKFAEQYIAGELTPLDTGMGDEDADENELGLDDIDEDGMFDGLDDDVVDDGSEGEGEGEDFDPTEHESDEL